MTQLEKLGKDFRMRRIASGMSQSELSQRAQISTVTICKVEKGSDNVSLKTLDKISDALDAFVLLNLIAK